MPAIKTRQTLSDTLYRQYAEHIKSIVNGGIIKSLGLPPGTPPSTVKGFRSLQNQELAKYPDYKLARDGGPLDSDGYHSFVEERYQKAIDEAVKEKKLLPKYRKFNEKLLLLDVLGTVSKNQDILLKYVKKAFDKLIPEASTFYVKEYDEDVKWQYGHNAYPDYVPVDEDNIKDIIFAIEKRHYDSVVEFMEKTRTNSYKGAVAETILEVCPEIVAVANEEKVPKRSIKASVMKVIRSAWDFEEFEGKELQEYCNSERMASLLSQNPKYAPMITAYYEAKKKDQELQENVLKSIPERYPDLYPMTRKMKRKFILHIGPTNSGKTYDAIKALENAGDGVYLAPLRLLAYEQYERINSDGYPCSLITGEEEMKKDDARITSSTIEMLNINQRYSVAVIDEAQMISDKSRGGAWTTAILGVMADEVHVCMAPEAENLIISIVNSCGDGYEIVRHERSTPLTKSPDPVNFPKGIQPKDALIAFSRRSVLQIAGELQRAGKKVSVIYGALPYPVRHNEAERFASGETDYLVATDAIGMGMNLPIKRIVLMEGRKYDGENIRPLNEYEIRQIIGRAGRRGIYDSGYWATDGFNSLVEVALNKRTAPLYTARIDFPKTLINLDAPLSAIISKWNKIKPLQGYMQTDTDVLLQLCNEVEQLTSDKALTYDLITVPFDIEKLELLTIWRSYKNFVVGKTTNPAYNTLEMVQKRLSKLTEADDIDRLEILFKEEDLIFQCVKKFCRDEEKLEETMKCKELISDRINRILAEKQFKGKTCRVCGRKLKWNFPYPMCDRCHEEQVLYRSWDRW